MTSRSPGGPVRFPLLYARWTTQTFVHWRYPPGAVQALLPPGVAVEVYDGAAWVGFTPFVMAEVRPPGVPASRWATFPETNLRTYVRGPDGRAGVWFLDIEAGSSLTLAARAAAGVPYHWADLGVGRHGDTVVYAGSRRGGGPSYGLVVRPGEPLRPSEPDVWLTSRWRAYSHRLGLVWETPIRHEPWSLSSAAVEELRETLTAAVGLPAPGGEPLVHYSREVRDVRIGLPRPQQV
ncbi:DUF2071 domain-containing protein [Streptomyces sp. TRM49041]|uniref:YqjF family protein n=1 Tax=Streptomyces sp. TRM49041 TaxID=2603216 RepID=UPI0021CCEC7F|nr:DUF2071 domain-containing protein [Streptomyces sp. TRM49041]